MGKGTQPRPEKMGGQRQVPKQDADAQDMEPTVWKEPEAEERLSYQTVMPGRACGGALAAAWIF